MHLKLAVHLKTSCYSDEIQLNGTLQRVHRGWGPGINMLRASLCSLALGDLLIYGKSEKR